LWTEPGVSFLRAIEWFWIVLPEITPLARAAPPPRATNKASNATIIVGLFQFFKGFLLRLDRRGPTCRADFDSPFCAGLSSPMFRR